MKTYTKEECLFYVQKLSEYDSLQRDYAKENNLNHNTLNGWVTKYSNESWNMDSVKSEAFIKLKKTMSSDMPTIYYYGSKIKVSNLSQIKLVLKAIKNAEA